MVAEKVTCCYDGSFEGFLSTIFEIYERKLAVEDIATTSKMVSGMFSTKLTMETSRNHAERVLQGIYKHAGRKIAKDIYRCFLSEKPGVEYRLLKEIKHIFRGNAGHFYDYGNENVMELHKILKMMRREVHRMHAFVRFQELRDGSFAAVIEPDFNVIPLIGEHFQNRYPAMEWTIFDTKRQYGIHYKDYKLTYITFEQKLTEIAGDAISEDEKQYQEMWKKYFASVNISERNNQKLHLRHVPKRYWKNLIEKQ